MDNIKKTITEINEKYKPLMMTEENHENNQSLAVDLSFLNKIPKSPQKLPKLKASVGTGNWQVVFKVFLDFTIDC